MTAPARPWRRRGEWRAETMTDLIVATGD